MFGDAYNTLADKFHCRNNCLNKSMKHRIFQLVLPVFFIWLPVMVNAQNVSPFVLTADDLRDGKQIALDKIQWKYRAGDDATWANPQTDDAAWDKIEGAFINPNNLPSSGWSGRGWFRLRLTVDESLVNRTLAFIATQRGASEIYLDGRKIATFGSITDDKIVEYNPNRLPIPFKFEKAGEYTLAVRFASRIFADFSSAKSVWMTNGGVYPGITISLTNADDVNGIIGNYASGLGF